LESTRSILAGNLRQRIEPSQSSDVGSIPIARSIILTQLTLRG
jgi:hypothetical protein